MLGKFIINKIITDKKSYLLLVISYWLFTVIFPIRQVQAVTVTNIQINPSSPVYNEMFECVLTVDNDESNLACDMLRVDDPDNKKPWDICPKINERTLGHRYTSGNQRHYNCIADSSTSVPGPGTYRIVAWRFYSDGSYGDVIASKQIAILDKPPPTQIPSPTDIPTMVPTRIPSPTFIVYPTLKISKISPTPIIIPPTETPIFPTVDFYPIRGAAPSPTPILLSVPGKISGVIFRLIATGKEGFIGTSNFLYQILLNFLRETEF